MLAFCMAVRELNSGLHAFKANTLPDQVSPQKKVHWKNLSCICIFTAPTHSSGVGNRVPARRTEQTALESSKLQLGHISTVLVCAHHADCGGPRLLNLTPGCEIHTSQEGCPFLPELPSRSSFPASPPTPFPSTVLFEHTGVTPSSWGNSSKRQIPLDP